MKEGEGQRTSERPPDPNLSLHHWLSLAPSYFNMVLTAICFQK